MTGRAFIAEWRQRLDNLNKQREAEALIIGTQLATLIKLRIQETGRNADGAAFAPYVPSYAKRRAKLGFQTQYVDFTRSGRLMANIRAYVANSNDTSTTIHITAREDDNQLKLLGALRKRGNILRPNDAEQNTAQLLNADRLRKYLGT